MLDPSSAPICFNARLTTDVSSCARNTPRHVVIRTRGRAAAMPRRGGRLGAHAAIGRELRSIGCMPATSVPALGTAPPGVGRAMVGASTAASPRPWVGDGNDRAGSSGTLDGPLSGEDRSYLFR